ncbi:threonine synthase [Candidatus Hecatella orcuttiae]|uniref:threonine synthase n=1 Tax=Candidatus Hecatella orcuttiae TaxID=1935119 RepID=UPI0028681847|nr:threonine synthase [Candidatus Hecatella orcuttiae]
MTGGCRQNYAVSLRCLNCDAVHDLRETTYFCSKCGGLLDVMLDYESIKNRVKIADILRRPKTMWRYAEFLPIDVSRKVSLGETLTPIYKAKKLSEKIGIKNLFFKLDYMFPTGSFKDRGSALMVSRASELRAATLAIDSSGNAATSVAAYAAKAGLECYIFTPSYASLGKIIQAMMNGASVFRVKGTRKDSYDIAREACQKFGWYYCGFQTNPYVTEGMKTIGHEICEQFNNDPPEWVVHPVGTGSGLLGCRKGFSEVAQIGWISKIPRLVCIQPEGCAPIAKAYKKGRNEIRYVRKPKTIAEGLMIGYPLKGKLVLKALRETGGLSETIKDQQIVEAASWIAKIEGLFVEPSSAASVAGTKKMLDEGLIDKNDRVLCMLTGSGLKTVETYSKMVKKPKTIAPSMKALRKNI